MQWGVEKVKDAGKGERCVEIVVGDLDRKRPVKGLFTHECALRFPCLSPKTDPNLNLFSLWSRLEPIQDLLFESPVIRGAFPADPSIEWPSWATPTMPYQFSLIVYAISLVEEVDSNVSCLGQPQT